ncbi:phage antirepressor KilAC domain-containing protein [Zooshikella sp. RANM57]|uniref:phage antirepressor KilAC domain-containing protein n=1 Tax=Zooshikella sp. RANM57 TaxID=3425863 RepID=UPI003D6F1970
MSTNNNANANAVAQTFTNGLFGSVRVLIRNGEPWFVATDIAKALGYPEAAKMTRFLDGDEKGRLIVETLGGVQVLSSINESGLYSAILKSRRAEAKQFKKWVTSEVLPSIRKTGGYIQAGPEDTPETIMAKAVLVADKTIKELQGQVSEMQPKADFVDNYVTTRGTMNLRDTAKLLNIPPHSFIQGLHDARILFYNKTRSNVPYQPFLEKGYFTVKTAYTRNREMLYQSTRVTARGLTWLSQKYNRPLAAIN